MEITGMLRVKNEARWIERVITALLPICGRIVVMDDHSTDGTAELSAAAGATVLPSPFEGLDECRDKNWLLERVDSADWIISIDGDEVVTQHDRLLDAMDSGAHCLTLPVLYLWNREDQVRTDGVYGVFRRQSAFRPTGAPFVATRHGGNFHCGNVPAALRSDGFFVAAPLLHFGYLHSEDRVRKHTWYNLHDPNNQGEDNYRHIVQGDIPEIPADVKLRHAGPLKLEPLCSAQ